MAVYETLRPRAGFDSTGSEDALGPTFSPITSDGLTLDEARRQQQRINSPVVSNMGRTQEDEPLQPVSLGDPSPAMRPGSFQDIGVNWSETAKGSDNPTLSAARTGFYNTDYDPEGKVSQHIGEGRDYVMAANVFGRQFSRDELMKDGEGQRLVHLMEMQRRGAHRDEGFWSGFASFKDTSGSYKRALADIPFIGWMVDAGLTVGETIDASKAMRKMQNGEAVTNHEALMVRRYMLQSEMDSERGIGYKAGEVFHSSIPFMVEMATAGYLTAKATAIGGAIGGPVGAAIGVLGGLIFGGVGAAYRMLAKKGASTAAKEIAKDATKATLQKIAKAEFGKTAVSFSETLALGRFVKYAAPDAARAAFDAARETGRKRALLAMGRASALERFGEKGLKSMSDDAVLRLGQTAAEKLGEKEFGKRASFEATKALAERYVNVVNPGMSARAARRFLVGGDQERAFHYGLMKALEERAVLNTGATGSVAAKGVGKNAKKELGYWEKKRLLRNFAKNGNGLTEAQVDETVKGFIEGTLKAGDREEGELLGRVASAVVDSMEASLGGKTVSHGYAREVLDYMGETVKDSFRLKYGLKGAPRKLFAANTERFARFVADGVLDGMFRWDTSVYGGLGTIARDGSSLGGKMNVLKEALKVSMVEAPVRGALQLGVQVPLWPVTAALSGNSPTDFAVKGQLDVQMKALQTGDRQLMDNARAIAIGAGLVEYASENAGRGFNMLMGGILKPAAAKLVPETWKGLGSALAKKVDLIFGTEAKMRRENTEEMVSKIANRIGNEIASGRVAGTASRAEITALVESGKATGSLAKILEALKLKPGRVVTDAFNEMRTDGRVRTAALGLVAFKMLRMGWTPQKMVKVLERVGYDGILSEMAEERYGGVVQGLLGFNNRPSDEGLRGRLSAAWDGMFPDKEQLVVEAIGFAIPSVSHLALSNVFAGAGRGALSELRRDCQSVNIVKSTRPVVSIGGMSAKYVAARREYQGKVDKETVNRFGTEESNRKAATSDVTGVMSRLQEAGKWVGATTPAPAGTVVQTDANKHLFGITNEAEMSAELDKLVQNIVETSGTPEELEENIANVDAENLLGKDAVEAIRNLKRLDPSYDDQAKKDFYANLATVVGKAPSAADYATPASVDDIVNEVEMTIPVRGEDMSAVASTKDAFSADDGIRANQYGSDVLGELRRAMTGIANAAYNLKTRGTTMDRNASVLSRIKAGGLSLLGRAAGALDALVTGDLSLAAANPVQWALADEALDKSMANTLLALKERSVRLGMASVLAEDRNVLAEMSDELRDQVQPVLKQIDEAQAKMNEYAYTDPVAYKAARNERDEARNELDEVLSVMSKSFDILRKTGLNDTTMAKFEAAGEPIFQELLGMYASRFLAARNVIAASQADLSVAALSVTAKDSMVTVGGKTRFKLADGTLVDNFNTDEFRRSHSADLEANKARIVDALVDMASGDAIRVNTNARFSVTDSTAAVVDYRRALRSGVTPEILAAIENMPVFANYRAVVDASFGAVTDEALSAIGNAASMEELLAITPDETGDIPAGDLMKIMRFRGRDFAYATPEQNQRDAKRFLTQLRILADNSLPYEHLDADGKPVDVTYARGVTDAGAPFISATLWRKEGDAYRAAATLTGKDVPEVVSLLKAQGVEAKMRRLVVAKSFSIASRDATSALLFRFGSRENARSFYLREGATEQSLPPQLRKVRDDSTGEMVWEYPSETDAAEALRSEITEASSPRPTGDADSYNNTYARVYGGDFVTDDGAVVQCKGYERIAESYLTSIGMRKAADLREENLVLGSGEMWVMRPNSLIRGDVHFITGDYNSSGDSEALLRATLESAILNKSVQEHNAGRRGFNGTMRGMCEAFDEAVASLTAELEPLKPEWAQRLRKLKETLDGASAVPGAVEVNSRKIAAIAASALCFTSDRGLNDRGNGFLLSPELAVVADELRASDYFTAFVSAVDEALGGVGLFSAEGEPGAKVRALLDAFAPTGAAVANARKSAIFNRTGEEGAAKPGVPYSYMEFAGVAPASDGSISASVGFHLGEFGEQQDLDVVRPDAVLDRIAESAAVVAEQFELNCGRGMTLEDAERMTRASMGGGESSVRLSVRRKKAPSAPVFGGGRVVRGTDPNSVPGTADVISSIDAAKLARGLGFLADDSIRKRILTGNVSDLEAGIYGKITVDDESGEEFVPALYKEVDRFLRSFDVDAVNRKVILDNLAIGIGEPIEDVEDQQDAYDDAEEEEERTDEGQHESFQEKRKADSAVRNKDLMEMMRSLRCVFPCELGNHTALFYRYAEELDELGAVVSGYKDAKGQDAIDKLKAADPKMRELLKSGGAEREALLALAESLNVFRRADADPFPENLVASAFDWGDADATDALLLNATEALRRVGRPDLALITNMLRMLGRGKKGTTRRAKALSDIAYMAPLDAEFTEVTFHGRSLAVAAKEPGTRLTMEVPVLRAVLGGCAMSPALQADVPAGLQDIHRMLSYPVEKAPRPNLVTPDTSSGSLVVPEGCDPVLADIANALLLPTGGDTTIPLVLHEALVRFSRKLAKSLLSASELLTVTLGSRCELSTILESRGLASGVLRMMEDYLVNEGLNPGVSPATAYKGLAAIALHIYELSQPSTSTANRYKTINGEKVLVATKLYHHPCTLLEELLAPVVALAKYTGAKTGARLSDAIGENMELVSAMARAKVLREVWHARDTLTRGEIIHNDKIKPERSSSTLSRLIRWYVRTAPRRTARVDIVAPDQFSDSGRATQTPASAPLAEYRLASSLFSKVKMREGKTWYEDYVSNGRRFPDGTRATVVSAGVKVGNRLAEGSAVPRYVYESNVERFVKKRDFRNVRFQLYHGEKPTVYSQQLPGELCNQIWGDILRGADYTKNRVTDAALESLKDYPDSLEVLRDDAQRSMAYDLLFSVVASHAGCAVIDPKRTQVLMAQGVMYAGHRDGRYVATPDGGLEYEDWSNEKPATHFLVSLFGDAADANLGMYLANGCLVEMQRATATNPDAVSFKNHLNKLIGAFLTKGQGHDMGLGLYEDEDVVAVGALTAAQACMRRTLEKLLGLERGILDLPDDKQKADKEYLGKREAAVKAVERFRLHSTVIHTDLETQKVGLFASRNGVKRASDGSFTVGGVRMSIKKTDDGAVLVAHGDAGEKELPGVPVAGVKKGKPVPLAVALAAYAAATDSDELTDSDVAALEAEWVGPNGTAASALSESGLLDEGDTLSVSRGEAGDFVAHYTSRHIIGQVMANNDASSEAGHHSPAPTNYDRDVAANQGLRDHQGEVSASRILTVGRAVPAALVRSDPDLVDSFLASDEDFAYRMATNPYDDAVRETADRKMNAMRAKAMRVYPKAVHAVLLGSGVKADIDRATHKVTKYHYSAGVTEYDKDAVRDSRILPSKVAAAYGLDRTMPSGLLNVTGDDSFRYGWHLDENAFDEHAADEVLSKVVVDRVSGSAKRREYQSVLDEAHGDTAQDTYLASYVAALVWAAHNGSAEQKAAVMEILGKSFTDYTGKHLSERLSKEKLNAVSFYDLFLNQDGARTGCDFDFTALEFGPTGRKVSRMEGEPRTIYLGGSLFSADRRPSGNLESSSGLSRAQAPVTFNRSTGEPGKTAMYVLSPVLNAVQGSDTDGDSATVMRFSDHGVDQATRDMVNDVFNYLNGLRESLVNTARAGKITRTDAQGIIRLLQGNPRYERFLRAVPVRDEKGKPILDGSGTPRTRIQLSDYFYEAVGDLLFETQVNNYRRTPTVEQDVAEGPDARARSGSSFADESETWDVGFAGRDPVGPDAVFDQTVDDAGSREIYRAVTGRDMPSDMSYADAFHDIIDSITESRTPESEMLLPKSAAYLSGEAADGGLGRATMVSLQASIENLGAFVRDDETMAKLCPALYGADRADGYAPLKDFIAHLDGISNALFDVVKDLFAPRAGWRNSMLNYLVASLLHDADAEYAAKTATRFGNAWFFRKLTMFARDFHASERSIPGLLKRTNADNNFYDRDTFIAPEGSKGESTFRGLLKDAISEGSGTVLRWLAETVPLAKGSEYEVPDEQTGKYVTRTASTFLEEADATFLGSYGEGFVEDAKRWMSAIVGAAGKERTLPLLVAALPRAPEAVRAAVLGGAEYDMAEERMSAFLGDLWSLLHASRVPTSAALAGHVMFESGDVAGAMTRAKYAFEALAALDDLRNTEGGLSAEPAFRAGGRKAKTKYESTGRAVDENGNFRADGADADYLTQMFVTQDLLADIVNTQFDQGLFAEQVKATLSSLEKVVSGNTVAEESLPLWYRREGISPVDMANKDEFSRVYAAALLSRKTEAGTVNANRKKLGRIAHTLVDGLESVMTDAVDAETEGAALADYRMEDCLSRMTGVLAAAWARLTEPLKDAKGNVVEKSYLGGAIVDSVVNGPVMTVPNERGRDISDAELFANLRVDESTGRISLASKLTPDYADRLRSAFATTKVLLNPVSVVLKTPAAGEKSAGRPIPLKYKVHTADGVAEVESDLTYADLAWLVQLKLCASQAFSSVTESDTRVDVSCAFTKEELCEQERYGAALEKTLVGRLLCLTGGDANSVYDIFRTPGGDLSKRSFVNGICEGLASASGQQGRAASAGLAMKRIQNDPPSPAEILLDAFSEGGEAFRALEGLRADEEAARQSKKERGIPVSEERLENQLVSSFADKGDFDTLRLLNKAPEDAQGNPQFRFVGTSEDGEETEYSYLEEAINSYQTGMRDAIATADDSPQTPKDTLRRMVAERKEGPWSFRNIAVDVIRATAEKYGDQVYKWLDRALAKGGDYSVDPATYGQVRMGMQIALDETMPPPPDAVKNSLRAPGVDVASEMAKRMTRSEFSKFLHEADDAVKARTLTNPLENIRYALETAFGKSSGVDKPGVKVERVTHLVDNVRVPSNLIRVTRYYKVKENGSVVVKPAVTYIAYGEMLALHEGSDAFVEELATSLAGDKGSREATLALLRGMTPAQVGGLAKATGHLVYGESDAGLTTNALLALTGLVRLGSYADYSTLFHEYFHQMLAFYRRTGVCSDADMAELAGRYSLDGKFDEEAAAEAFAEYVVGKAEGKTVGKLLSEGVGAGDDKLFKKFLTTAQALLAGATAMDADGAPAFMKMLVTGDFSARSVFRAAEISKAEMTKCEKMILKAEVDAVVRLDWQKPADGVARSESDVVAKLAAFNAGNATADDVKAAVSAFLGDSSDASAHPEFPASDKPFGAEAPADAKPEAVKPAPLGESVEEPTEKPSCVAMAEFLASALGKVDRRNLSPDELAVLDALKSKGADNYDGAADCLLIARSLLRSTSAAFGLSPEKAANADTLFELAVRLAHKLESTVPASARAADNFDDALASHRVLALKVLNRFPTERWHDAVMSTAAQASDMLLRLRENLARAPETASVRWACRVSPFELLRVLRDLAEGKTPGLVTIAGYPVKTTSVKQVLEALFPGVKFVVRGSASGKMSAVGVEDAFGASSIGPEAQSDVEATMSYIAHAVGMAMAYGRLLRENGADKPAPGAAPVLPAKIKEPPPPGALEPDFSPQMILQSQSSWMASDLMRNFFGVDLRDIMTDTSLRAAVEQPNALMNALNFYFGADVGIGDRAREVTLVRSKLGVKGGAMESSEENAHQAYRYGGVRGYALGIVTREAKKLGRAFDLDDVTLVNFVLQAAGYIANGETKYITGIDLSGDHVPRLVEMFKAKTYEDVLAGNLSPAAVISRVHGKRRGEAVGEERATNLDQTLYKILVALPSEVSGVAMRMGPGKTVAEIVGNDEKGNGKKGNVEKGKLYDRVVRAYFNALRRKSLYGRNSSVHIETLVAEDLAKTGHSVTSGGGKTAGTAYLTIPLDEIRRAWDSSKTVDKLEEAGRTRSLLGLDRAAQQIATAAAEVNRAAMRSRFIRESLGNVITGQNFAGLWFDSGSGGHALALRTFQNAGDFFDIPISDDETLKLKADAFGVTMKSDMVRRTMKGVRSLATGRKGGTSVRGLERAFELDKVTGDLVNLPVNRVQHLMQLMGLGARASRDAILKFVSGVYEGMYARGSTVNPSFVDLRTDMTVFELDRAIYELECLELHKAVRGEGDSILTRPASEGGYGYEKQDLVDLNEILRREGMQMMFDEAADRRVGNLVSTLTAEAMLASTGELPSAKTGPERVMAMADSLVTSERFRGCLAQMLASVGTNGMPNYIVSPGAAAESFAPDPYWGALAKFVGTKLASLTGNRFSYDDTESGVENMRRLADRIRTMTGRDEASGKAKTRIPWHLVPPKDVQTGNLFSFMLALDDSAEDDNDLLNKAVGGEAEGYIKQLFGAIQSPTVWGGWRSIDRIMGLSKALSVGMSAFFAFATRFESPVAACGLFNTLAGYGRRSSDWARKLGEKLRKHEAFKGLADFFNFEENMVYLQDFRDLITSDDPAIAQMREFMDLLGMPLSDSIRNPMSDTGGQIDADIRRISDMFIANGHDKLAKEVRGLLNAALHNPGEYAFSNVLNCVKMAVVAQTLLRLRRECEAADRPFDPIREMRRFSSYINAEIGGIQPERYAWLTPGTQQVLRLAMFSYSWTMGAWTAGTGEVVTDLIFGGHHTNRDTRRFAFIRWLRMLGIVKVGVPVVLQAFIRGLAGVIQKLGWVGVPDDPDDKDPLGIEDMPWLCFDNESKIGALSFDITPLLRLCGRLRRGAVSGLPDGAVSALPAVSSVVGGLAGAAITRSVGGALIGANAGAFSYWLTPNHTGVGHGRNTSGNRRYYMHFGKQSDEFWRWFTDPWSQATNKMSIPTQKVVEAFFGSTNGSNFGKNFSDKPLLDRFLTTDLDPQENAVVNLFTAFLPFSAASMASNPDAGVLGMFAPVQMGASMTGQQKKIAARLEKLARDDRPGDVWAESRNHRELRLLAADILRECRMNGFQPDEVLNSGLGTAAGNLYKALYSALPKTKDDSVNGREVAEIFRAMRRINVKKTGLEDSLWKKYKNANIDLEKPRNAATAKALRRIMHETGRDPWLGDETMDELLNTMFDDSAYRQLRSVDVQQDRKGGEAFSNFLATDEVPETLFGIPVVSQGYTDEDLEFFKRNPKAAGFYDLGDEEAEPEPPPDDGGGGGLPVAADKGGDTIDAPTLSDEGRPLHIFRDVSGKVTGYGTTESIVHEDNGKYFVIPTILGDGAGNTRKVSDADARGWYAETGEHWGSYRTAEAAEAAAQALHERHQALYRDDWSDYIHDHWDEMSDSIKNDPGEALVHARRLAKYPGAWNNPGNVEPGEVEYSGESGTVKAPSERVYLTFRTPKDGLNAMAQSIGQIARVKIPNRFKKGELPDDKFTVGNLIKIYAPAKDDNDPEGYAAFVADRLGVSKDAELDMKDARQMGRLLDAMVRRDSGHPNADWFRKADFQSSARRMLFPARKKRNPKNKDK